MRVAVKSQGLRELEKALMELPRATARNVAKRPLLKSAAAGVEQRILHSWPDQIGAVIDPEHLGDCPSMAKAA